MKEYQFAFSYHVFDSEKDLNQEDLNLLITARKAASVAYAPYSEFFVGAAALLSNQQIVTGSNQENASYPSGICAERSLLASAAQLYPNIPILTLAVTYLNSKGKSDYPASPCGFCRQVLVEFEKRVQHPIRLLIGGITGQVFVIPQASLLLPLSFSSDNLL